MNKKQLKEYLEQGNLKCQTAHYSQEEGEEVKYYDPVDFEYIASLIQEETGFKIGEVVFEFVSSERTSGDGDYNGYEWVYQVGDNYFMWSGWYSSYGGAELEDDDFEQVELKTKTVEYWSTVKN